jgi:hypothetical protein
MPKIKKEECIKMSEKNKEVILTQEMFDAICDRIGNLEKKVGELEDATRPEKVRRDMCQVVRDREKKLET